jgi:hypothetical protein
MRLNSQYPGWLDLDKLWGNSNFWINSNGGYYGIALFQDEKNTVAIAY